MRRLNVDVSRLVPNVSTERDRPKFCSNPARRLLVDGSAANTGERRELRVWAKPVAAEIDVIVCSAQPGGFLSKHSISFASKGGSASASRVQAARSPLTSSLDIGVG